MIDSQPPRVEHVGSCGACGGIGSRLHEGLPDRLFGTAGTWALRRCGACGSAWLDPRPVLEDLPLGYASYYTHAVDEAEPATSRSRLHEAELGVARSLFTEDEELEGHRLVRAAVRVCAGRRADATYLAAHLPVQKGAPLLDVGCGDGRLLDHLGALGWNAEGVETDAVAVAAARRRGLRVTSGEVEAAGFADGSFAAVVLSHVIEHLPDPAASVAEVRRILRPDGQLVVITPNVGSILHRAFGRDWFHLDPPRHLVLFSRNGLDQLLRAAGFSVELRDSWRGANVTIAASTAYRRRRTYDMTSPPTPVQRVYSELGQQLLATAGRALRGRSDEIVAIARPRMP